MYDRYRRKIIETANECGLTGMKRVVFYAISPFVMGVSFTTGFIRGTIRGIVSSINK